MFYFNGLRDITLHKEAGSCPPCAQTTQSGLDAVSTTALRGDDVGNWFKIPMDRVGEPRLFPKAMGRISIFVQTIKIGFPNVQTRLTQRRISHAEMEYHVGQRKARDVVGWFLFQPGLTRDMDDRLRQISRRDLGQG